MELHEVIQKAIESGYIPKYDFDIEIPNQVIITDDGSICLTGEGGKILGVYDIEKIILDSLFWQALGEEMEWDKEITAYITFDKGKENNESWRLHWHQLIDHLAEDKSIEDYFKNL